MRFHDEPLVTVLGTMRQPQGCELAAQEWDALHATELKQTRTVCVTRKARGTDRSRNGDAAKHNTSANLEGTERWCQSAYGCNVVTKAQSIRSHASARAACKTLYLIQAEDHILNRPPHSISVEATTEAIFRHPNMNDTGLLPNICMLHLGMQARLTLTVEPLVAVPDATGIVEDIRFDPREPAIKGTPSVHTLQYMPLAVLFQLDANDTEPLPPKHCETHANGPSGHDVHLLRQCPHCAFFEEKP